jgi:hypothetical protein
MTSKIKVDNINKVSDDSNIINKCGTTITLGASGDSISFSCMVQSQQVLVEQEQLIGRQVVLKQQHSLQLMAKVILLIHQAVHLQ